MSKQPDLWAGITALPLLVLCAALAHGAEQSLEQAANDPTAALMNVQLSDWYTESFHNLDDESANSVVLRSAIPFEFLGQNNIFRVTAPFVTDSLNGSTGLADITLFDLVTRDASWGRWGCGAVALLPTGGEKRGAEQWGLAPAIGFTARSSGMLWGLFNQNIFTVTGEDDREEVNVSSIQPILNRKLGNGWSMGLSEMSIVYDWENSRWASLPLGFKLIKLVKFNRMPVQFAVDFEYNFADDRIGPERIFRFTTKLIFPAPGQ